MNSKGFTLVEMLVTIAVFGLILGIAIPSYTGISKSINNRHRNNLIKRIEIAASKYAADTGKTLFFVNELVTEGYIDSDDNGFVFDPVSKEKINCHKIVATKEGNYYDASYDADGSYEANGECNSAALLEDSRDINILVSSTTSDNTSGWIRSDPVILTFSGVNMKDFSCLTYDCYLYNTNGLEKKIENTTYSIDATDKIINTTYIFKYIYKYTDTNDQSIEEKYVKKLDVRIDNEDPVIYLNQIKSTIKDKKIVIKASDGSGSGIGGYSFQKSSDCTNAEYGLENEYDISSDGQYYICVKDNVGNISRATIQIENILN